MSGQCVSSIYHDFKALQIEYIVYKKKSKLPVYQFYNSFGQVKCVS